LTYPDPVRASKPTISFPSARDFPAVVTRLFDRLAPGTAAMLSLPIWFVTERAQESPSVNQPCAKGGGVLAFSSTENLTEFLAERQSGEWKINLVGDREGLILIIAIAHNHGMETICMDAKPDGSGGTELSLSDLMNLVRSMR
jgi:hypothetical protein